ncbi:HalD/BesD family halogenase [Actinoplanes regularis]|uniref:2OG-Fe(II) oxygenase superfamily protein n=1 Tax=Actinoplanes regularis TaxID=52697 RepID=A0A239HAH9_9ACTN|nr:2OG-Fe(II) oxygenase [Actinoplanes regularis]GIE90967.1 hypothetical protein Are01nite_74470 [Actinoplanes regularis]SNS78370.1 hypothetical protein SAMN06264365_1246 [Actinoplanes regularis]
MFEVRTLHQDVREHVERSVTAEEIAAARRDFSYLGHAKVSFAAPESVKKLLAEEVNGLIEKAGTRRDLSFAETDYTPRRMRNVTRKEIFELGTVINEVYTAEPLMRVLSEVAGEPVHVCPYEAEQYVITCLERDGDTHGWHWDDFAFALVWVIECPPVEEGGFVQCVPGTTWDKKNPAINRALVTRPIYSMELFPGDLYLMRTNTTLHRVYPVRSGRRKIVNMGYASTTDLNREFTHETMDQLWAAAPGGEA